MIRLIRACLYTARFFAARAISDRIGSDEIALEFRFSSIFIGPVKRESDVVRSDDALVCSGIGLFPSNNRRVRKFAVTRANALNPN